MIRPQAAEGKSPAAPESTTDHSLHHAGVALLSHWECGGRAAPPLPPSRACRTMRAAHSRGPRPAPPLVIPAFAGIQGGRAARGIPLTPSSLPPPLPSSPCPNRTYALHSPQHTSRRKEVTLQRGGQALQGRAAPQREGARLRSQCPAAMPCRPRSKERTQGSPFVSSPKAEMGSVVQTPPGAP